MPTVIACPGCNHDLELPEAFAGQRAQCPECRLEFALPPPVPAMEVESNASGSNARKPVEADTAYASGDSRRARAPADEPPIYCMECGAKYARGEEACPECGFRLDDAFEETARQRRRSRRRMIPVHGYLPILGAIQLAVSVLFFIAAPIADEIMRRGPARELVTVALVLIGGVIALSGVGFCMAWLYQAWRMVSRGDEEYSPGLMVGLLFVPFFNLYWMFRTVPGLSSAIARELRYVAPARRLGAGWEVGLVACILFLIPYFQPIAFCIFLAWMFIANNALHRLARLHEERSEFDGFDEREMRERG